MRNDATEAALGLLGLTGSIDFRTTTTIPLKRTTTTTAAPAPPSPPIQIQNDNAAASTSSETIDCVCGFTYDDGFSVACDFCGTWVHAACFDIVDGKVPEIFKCWKCKPEGIDREKAIRIQRAKQKDLAEVEKHRRRVTSPGVDRKRRVSAAAIDGSSGSAQKRRRRISISTHQQQPHHPVHPIHPSTEDEHVDIDEPATHSYVHTDKDFIPHQHTRDRLKRLAQHWRGVTALDVDGSNAPVLLSPDAFPSTPQTSLHPLPKSSFSHPTLSSNINPLVRPPSYTVRTTQPIPSSSLIAPYTSTVIPSTVYLSDPLNSYAHLGMPKPFVHLVGPPLDVALDSRIAGNSTRFVRNGCRPNAVLRPVLCRQPREGSSQEETLTFGVFALRDLKAQEEVVLGWEWDDGSVIHHLPALIDSPHLFAPARFELYRHQMTSMLHALSSTFTTCACGAKAKDCALNRLADFVDGQTPLTPAPSPPSLPDDRRAEERGGNGTSPSLERPKVDLGPLLGGRRGFKTRERVPMSGGMSGVEMDISASTAGSWKLTDEHDVTHPQAGSSRQNGCDKAPPKQRDRKGKGRAVDEAHEMEVEYSDSQSKTSKVGPRRSRPSASTKASKTSISPLQPHLAHGTAPERVGEARLPPKLRKKWIHRSSEVLKETSTSDERASHPSKQANMEVDDLNHDAKVMPPPPLPTSVNSPAPPSPLPPSSKPPSLNGLPAKTLPAAEATSPTASFANLSLLSPLVTGPTPHFPGAFPRLTTKSPSPLVSRTHTILRENTNSSHATPPSPKDEKSILGSPFVRRDPALPSDVTTFAPPPMSTSPQDLHSGDSLQTTAPLTVTADRLEPTELGVDAQVPSVAQAIPVEEIETISSTRRLSPSSTLVPQADDVSTATPEPIVASVEEHPSTTAPPKVKLSLKDFALRKKRQREEQAASGSPIVENVALASEHLEGVAMKTATGELNEKSKLLASNPVLFDDVPAKAIETLSGTNTQKISANHTGDNIMVLDDHIQSTLPYRRSTLDDSQCSRSDSIFERPSVDHKPTSEGNEDVEMKDDRCRGAEPVTMPSRAAKVELSDPECIFENVYRNEGFEGYSDKPHTLQSPPSTPGAARPSSSQIFQSTMKGDELPSNSPDVAPSSPHLQSLSHTHQHTQSSISRQISQEDGEIFSPPAPPSNVLPSAPRAHSPPTHPRSFHTHSSSHSHSHSSGTSPTRSSIPSRRPLGQPTAYRPQLQSTSSSRPLPSGPRALRGVGGGGGSGSSYSPGGYSSSSFPHMAPRAPSADRDRLDWDRDRGNSVGSGRVSGSSGSWGRSRGGWVR